MSAALQEEGAAEATPAGPRLLRAVLETAAVPTLLADDQNRVVDMNRAAEQLLGSVTAVLRGCPLGDLFRPEGSSGQREVLGFAGEPSAGRRERIEAGLIRRDGSVQPIALTLRPLADVEGRPVGALLELHLRPHSSAPPGSFGFGEGLFRAIAETANEGIWLVDNEARTVFANERMAAILGCSAAEMAGRSVLEFAFPDEAPAHRERIGRNIAGQVEQFETRFRRTDGSEVHVLAGTSALSDPEGRIIGALGMFSDITRRKRAEQGLRESEERLRVALAAGRMGTWAGDLITGRQTWDAREYELLGIDPSLPPSRDLFLSCVHPDDIAKVGMELALSDRTRNVLDSEFRIIRPDGEVRWLAARAVVRHGPTGTPREVIGVNWDVTASRQAEAALRESEERFRVALAAGKMGAWDWEIPSGEIFWDEAQHRIFGTDRASFVPTFEGIWAFVHREDRDRLRRLALTALESGQAYDAEFRIVRPSGEVRWCVGGTGVTLDARGRPTRMSGVTYDITERKLSEERQRLLLNELNHRVKNTLATVQSIVVQTIRASSDPRDAFERVQSRLVALSSTHNLLQAASWLGTSLRDLLKTELKPFRGQSGDRISLSGGPVELDPRNALALGLIVHELATNAAKYGSLSVPSGRVSVSWDVGREANGEEVDLRWVEHGGPSVTKPTRKGFGSTLIERSVSGELQGRLELDYAATGLRCRISFPVRGGSLSTSGQPSAK